MFLNLKKHFKNSLYSNSILIIVNSIIVTLTGFIFWAIATKFISSNDIGIATTSISFSTLIIIISIFGMDVGLMRYFPEYNNKEELYNTIIITSLVISLILSIITLIILYNTPSESSIVQQKGFVLLFIIYVIVGLIYTFQNALFIIIRRGDLLIFQNIILLSRIPLLAITSFLGVTGILISINFAYIISIIFGFYVLNKYNVRIGLKFNKKLLANIFKYSFSNYLGSILSYIPVSIIPIMVISILGAKESAYFYIAYSIAGILFMIPTAISTSLFVEGSHNIPMKDNIIKSFIFILCILIPGVVFTYTFGDKLLLLFSKEYSINAVGLLRLLAISSLFSVIPQIYLSINKVNKNTNIITILNLSITALIVGLSYILLVSDGLNGLGIAWVISYVIISIMIVVYDQYTKRACSIFKTSA